MAKRQHRAAPMVGNSLAGKARHAPEQVRAKRDIGHYTPEERPVDAAAKALLGKTPGKVAEKSQPPAAPREVCQKTIDLVRTRVVNFLMAQEVARCERHYATTGEIDRPHLDAVYHLWFKGENPNAYELRTGNPPPDDPRDRPKHLLRKDLVIDTRAITTEHWVRATVRLAMVMNSKYRRSLTWADAIVGRQETHIITPDDVGKMH